MNKVLLVFLVLSLTLHFPKLSAQESNECDIDCDESKIISVMPDINVVVYKNGSSSYWVDTKTGCHFLLPNNTPKTDKAGNDVCYGDLRI